MAPNTDEILRQLAEIQGARELSIIKLSEPILAQTEHSHTHSGSRSSDIDTSDTATPESLDADLVHYKELFTKLRFSYVEQTTKEKFLRAVVGDPPIYVTASENTELESHLSTIKASLKAQKTEIAGLVAELERQSRELSRRHHVVQLQTEQIRALPTEITNLQETIETLREGQATDAEDPAMNLPMPQTSEILAERRRDMELLEERLAAMEAEKERKNRELARLRDEVQPLQAQNANATAAARDARRRKDEGVGAVGDELEERGRWLRGVEATMRGLLQVEG